MKDLSILVRLAHRCPTTRKLRTTFLHGPQPAQEGVRGVVDEYIPPALHNRPEEACEHWSPGRVAPGPGDGGRRRGWDAAQAARRGRIPGRRATAAAAHLLGSLSLPLVCA